MPASNDVLLVLKQARDGRMAKSKLIEVIVAREGSARRSETMAEVEKVLQSYIAKGRIASKTEKGTDILILRQGN